MPLPSQYLGTTTFKMLTKTNGEKDNRYKTAQFCKSDGSRDKRTNLSNKQKKGNSTSKTSEKRTSNLHIPLKTDGTKDKRYTSVQFCNSDGKKDKRTTSTRLRK